MPLFLVGLRSLLVSPLVVADDLACVPQFRDPPTPTEQCLAPHVERPAHLLGTHQRVFPPAAAACGRPRTPARPKPGSGGGSTRYSRGPRSASTRLPASRGGRRAPRPTGGRRPPAPARAGHPLRWSGSTSPPPS